MKKLIYLFLLPVLLSSTPSKKSNVIKEEKSSKKMCVTTWYVTNNHSTAFFASARFVDPSSEIWSAPGFISPSTTMEQIWFSNITDPSNTGQPYGMGDLRVTLGQTTGQSGCIKVYQGSTFVTSQPWSSATGVTTVDLYIPISAGCGYFEIVINNGPC